MNGNIVTYFDSFRVERISEFKKFKDNKNITTSIHRIQACDSIMFGYFCIEFIGFMLNNKRLADVTNFVSPNNLNINDEILKYFQ